MLTTGIKVAKFALIHQLIQAVSRDSYRPQANKSFAPEALGTGYAIVGRFMAGSETPKPNKEKYASEIRNRICGSNEGGKRKDCDLFLNRNDGKKIYRNVQPEPTLNFGDAGFFEK